MGCVPSKAKVLAEDAPAHGANTKAKGPKPKREKKPKPGPASPEMMESPPPWINARQKLVIDKDGNVQFQPKS